MSWLMGAASEPTGPMSKKGKTKESDDVVSKKLLVQLEARMRAQEHFTQTQIHMAADHPLVTSCQAQYQAYLELVKKEGAGHQRGPPELQLFSKALQDIENWLSGDSYADQSLKRFKGLPTRIKSMLEHGSSEDASEWIKDFTFSQMYDTTKVRLTMSIRGHVLIAASPKNAEAFHKSQMEAWGGAPTDPAFEDVLQRSPLEVPAIEKGVKAVEVQHAISMILRGWNGSKKVGRVPRGPMAKQMMGKK